MPLRMGVILLGWWLASGASADIYRCNNDGLIAYQDTPCPGAGSRVTVPVEHPSAEAVARQQAELAAMRALVEEIAPPPPVTSMRAAPLAAESKNPAAAEAEVATTRKRRDNSDRSSTGNCPLGLSSCSKAGNRVFRRPKANPGFSFPAARSP